VTTEALSPVRRRAGPGRVERRSGAPALGIQVHHREINDDRDRANQFALVVTLPFEFDWKPPPSQRS